MSKKMLIDASHPEETRVAVVNGSRIDELDFESENKRQLRGNVYLARVTRVEPSLQAAFVEYGGNRHGFLAFSEIHPDYYQIPYEDRMALLEAEEAENIAEDAEDEKEDDTTSDDTNSEESDSDEADEDVSEDASDSEDDDDDAESDEETDGEDEDVVEEQAKISSSRRKRMSRRRYKIQEVIKRGQILLIQVVKEERGNKGAAMTTYLSMAGRYCVLMPNTPRGGGISRKIANGADRKRLKAIVSEFDVPQGMGVIVRTAGAKRTKLEIKRDYDYLSRLWETTRDTTLKSIAPALIHEEGNLVKRSIRDLYNKDISEILVQGDEAYKTAKSFIKMLMPSHAKNVKAYKDPIPLFLRYQVEKQLEESLDSVVQLKSGGYLVIHPTEALVSVDVNSGRSTKERNVERTALKTNLEAAEEVARQMRLRDLAGLIVIDFIDMDENRNNRAVEKRMKEALSQDRARVQNSRISQFGLMEISRQRRRRSLLEGSTAHCEHCQGVGRKRTVESSALRAIRAIEEIGARGQARRIRVTVAPDVLLYLVNDKRDLLNDIDERYEMFTVIVADDTLIRPDCTLEVIETGKTKTEDPLAQIEREAKEQDKKSENKSKRKGRRKDKDDDADTEDQDAPESSDDDEDESGSGKRRRRRGRRGGRRRKSENEESGSEDTSSEDKDEETSNTDSLAVIEPKEEDTKPKRGRRRKSSKKADSETGSDTTEDEKSNEEDSSKEDKPRSTTRRKAPSRKPKSEVEDTAEVKTEETETKGRKVEDEKPKSTTRRKAPARKKKQDAETDVKEPASDEEKPKSKSRRKAPAKTATAKKMAADPEIATPEDKESTEAKDDAPKSTTRRKAPKRKSKPEPKSTSEAPPESSESVDAPTEHEGDTASKPVRSTTRRKAPVRKKKEDTETDTPEKSKPKAKPKAKTKAKPKAKKADEPATDDAQADAPEAQEAPRSTSRRKAPTRKKVEVEDTTVNVEPEGEAPEETSRKATANTAKTKTSPEEKPAKRGWFRRKKKD